MDECNGIEVEGEFAYFLTDTYPFVPRCLMSETTAGDEAGSGGAGGGGGPGAGAGGAGAGAGGTGAGAADAPGGAGAEGPFADLAPPADGPASGQISVYAI